LRASSLPLWDLESPPIFDAFIGSPGGALAPHAEYAVDMIFTEEELEALDGHGEESEDSVPNTEPDSPLKRVQKPDDEPEPKPMTNGEQQACGKNEELPVILGKTAQTDDKAKTDDAVDMAV